MTDQTAVLKKALAEGALTRTIDLEEGALARLPALFAAHFPGRTALIVADEATFAAAGRESGGAAWRKEPPPRRSR